MKKLKGLVAKIQKKGTRELVRLNSIKAIPVLSNRRGGIFNNALDIVIDVVIAGLLLAAFVLLFNSNILPNVKTNISSMFSTT